MVMVNYRRRFQEPKADIFYDRKIGMSPVTQNQPLLVELIQPLCLRVTE